MKQLAVEFFRREIIVNSITKEDRNGRFSFKIGLSKLDELSSKANELEKQQLDDYAIDFAEWLMDGHVSKLTLEEFKKQKGL
jgi:hypothetical protein